MDISIKDGLAEVKYNRGRRHFKKTVQLNSLIGAMISEHGVRTPLLPMGTRQYIKDGESHVVLIEVPAMRRGIKYVNRSDKVIFEGIVPFPWGLLELRLVDQNGLYRVVNSSLYALSRPIISESDKLYYWPAANMFNNNRICWGSTSSSSDMQFKTIAEAGRVIDLYFSGDFNTDLHPRLNGYSRYEDMLRSIKDKESFDNSILVETSSRFLDLL